MKCPECGEVFKQVEGDIYCPKCDAIVDPEIRLKESLSSVPTPDKKGEKRVDSRGNGSIRSSHDDDDDIVYRRSDEKEGNSKLYLVLGAVVAIGFFVWKFMMQ